MTENLEIGGYLLGRKEVPDRFEAVLEFFPRLKGVTTRKASKLSGGERKMIAMGRVLMLSPAVLVLDEPTANLAPLVATQLLEEYIRGFADHGSTVLLVSSVRRPPCVSRTGRMCSAADGECSRVRPRTSRRTPRSWNRFSVAGGGASVAGRLSDPRGRRHDLRTLNP